MGKKAEDGEQLNDEAGVLDNGELGDADTEGLGTQAGGEDESESQDDQGTGDVSEVVVTIGEEPPPPEEEKQAPEWVRELRKNYRELQRENRELKAKQQQATTETKPVAVGAKPKLEDFDYDTEQFEQELAKWYDRKREAEQQEAKIQAEQEAQQKAWQSKLDAYGKAKAELKVKDFDDAEATVQESMNVTQQGIILQGAENPALVIYALGKNPKKAKEISSITDPVKFAFTVAKLETQLKVTNRKAAPPPEKTVRGTGPVSGAVDSTLERLRAEAEKTGNYTKVLQYKRQLREAGK